LHCFDAEGFKSDDMIDAMCEKYENSETIEYEDALELATNRN
jgi:hypothetical protein